MATRKYKKSKTQKITKNEADFFLEVILIGIIITIFLPIVLVGVVFYLIYDLISDDEEDNGGKNDKN